MCCRQALDLTIYAIGPIWSPEKRTYVDEFAFVFVHEETGRRQRVEMPMAPLTPAERKEAEAVRARLKGLPGKGHYPHVHKRAEVMLQLPTLPAATTVRRHSTATWTPEAPAMMGERWR